MTERPFITHKGKSYPLFQRGSKPDTPWSVRVQHKGERRSISTATADIPQAKQRAALIVESALQGDWTIFDRFRYSNRRSPHKPYATIGEVIKASETLPAASAKHYRRSLIEIVKTSSGQSEAKILKLATSTLTAPLVRSYQAAMQGLPKADPNLPTEKNATANSMLKNARCLFSRRAMAHYEKLELNLPDLQEFMAVPLLISEQKRYSDNPITDACLREMDAAMPSLPAAVRKAHEQIRLHGYPPGSIPSAAAHAHARFLKRWGYTPSDLWHHSAASMYRKTGSLEVAAKWASLTLHQAKWHIESLKKPHRPLTYFETYLSL